MASNIESDEPPTLEFVNPGPLDPSLLVDQDNHASRYIWRGKEQPKLENVGSSIGMKQWVLNQRQRDVVRNAGFGFCLESANIVKCDVGLIQGLIERWSPETNSFHLPVGEVTVTLEDVKFITGLPIRGKPVTSVNLKGVQRKHFQQILNLRELNKNDVRDSGIKLTVLRKHFSNPKENMTREDEDLQLIAFFMDCVGSVILPNSSKSNVHAKYLNFFVDFESIGDFSWGSATLSHLYRSLTKCTVYNQKYFYGCNTLLQIWAWERISIARPVVSVASELLLPRVLAYGIGNASAPKRRRDGKNPHHVPVTFVRGELDSFMILHKFTWDPYSKFFKQVDHEDYQDFLDWRRMARTMLPLIHFDEVEYQLPDRVLMQFSLLPQIPSDPPRLRELRVAKDVSFERVDATQKYGGQVAEWARIVGGDELHPVGGDDTQSYSIGDYLRWYYERTRLRIHPLKFGIAPGSSYYPRSIFNEFQAFNVMEQAIVYYEKSIGCIPESNVDARAAGKTLIELYELLGRGFRHPRFRFVPRSSEGSSQSQQDSEHSGLSRSPFRQSLMLTPSLGARESPKVHNVSSSPPDAPVKDKGKKALVHNSSVSCPPFSLGLSEVQMLSECEFFSIGYEEDGGDYLRPIDDGVKQYIDENYFADSDDVGKRTVNINTEGDIPLATFQTLRPHSAIFSHLIAGYVGLLRVRELKYERQVKYWITDTFFMDLCFMDWGKFVSRSKRKEATRGVFVPNDSVLGMLESVEDKTMPIMLADYALIPFLFHAKGSDSSQTGHFSMLMYGIKTGKLAIIDSLDVEAAVLIKNYDKQLKVVSQFLPYVLRTHLHMDVSKFSTKEKKDVFLVEGIPKQSNDVDCGIFLLKVIDVFLRQSAEIPPSWSDDEVNSFRYWIAWELINNKARG